MKLKRMTAFILAALLLIALSACTVKPNPATTAKPNDLARTEPLADAAEQTHAVYEITVWCDNSLVALTERQIAEFNKANLEGILVQAAVQGVDEDEAAARMCEDAASGADLFCFPGDRLYPLVRAGALTRLEAADAAFVNDCSLPNVAAAAGCDGSLYAYPISADGGCILYYDTSVIRNPANLDEMLADCEEAEKRFCFDLENGWYLASFFFGAGCVTDWTLDANGGWVVNDTFDSDKGLIAMKGLHKLLCAPQYDSKSDVSEFAKGAAAVVSGIWDYDTAKLLLGNNLGLAVLPSFTVDEADYALGSFLNARMLGVRPQRDADRAAALHKLARYLAGAEAQTERVAVVGWCPSSREAMQTSAVQKAPALAVAVGQAERAAAQNVPDGWWSLTVPLAAAAGESDEEEELLAALKSYHDAMELLKTPKPVLIFTGAWNGWSNAAMDQSCVLSGEGELLSLTLEIPAGENMGGRIVQSGGWENDKGYAQITVGKELALDLGDENPDNNIVFAAPGSYKISINTASNEITLEKLD